MPEPDLTAVYRYEFTIPASAADRNGHVNNVVYVQWMQDAAVGHSDATGGTRAAETAGASWVVRSHKIEYLNPAFPAEQLTVFTWVVNFRRVRSLRRYTFVRQSDAAVIARGETEWVFVDAVSGRPRRIPEAVMRAFPLVAEDNFP